MMEPTTDTRIESASVTDRGLNERRPLNEDSLLEDVERHIFAVADGVGGAEAGEVASQTAIEVLGEAFRHHKPGDDPEDLMEIAIQRANASIYQMSREQPKLAMMATTLVALHLEGQRATIGHVGDSRLYRLTNDGKLRRETDDHSVVEEEVRAGRMTAEQAINHPSRNVISRAIGAESSVEVDMKTIETEPGTVFLLCSDGITRHLPDEELESILNKAASLEEACGEMKKVCYERGAEDNLTALVVRVGIKSQHESIANNAFDDEVTILSQRPQAGNAHAALTHGLEPNNASLRDSTQSEVLATTTATTLNSPAASAFNPNAQASPSTSAQTVTKSKSGGAGRVLGVILLLLAASGLAFYGGMFYQQRNAPQASLTTTASQPLPSASSTPTLETAEATFEKKRRVVDLSPVAEAARMNAEMNNQPMNSIDPEFLYLYGRALLLSGKNQEAASAFEKSVQLADENMTARNGELKIDARLAGVAAHLRANDQARANEAAKALEDVVHTGEQAAPSNSQPSPTVTPL